MAILVLIMFVVYVANLGNILSAENEDADITDETNLEKFRYFEQYYI